MTKWNQGKVDLFLDELLNLSNSCNSIAVNQVFYAIMDPQWGNPVVIPETIRPSICAAKDAVLWMDEHSLYHRGCSITAVKGNWDGMVAQGYKVVSFQVDEVTTYE